MDPLFRLGHPLQADSSLTSLRINAPEKKPVRWTISVHRIGNGGPTGKPDKRLLFAGHRLGDIEAVVADLFQISQQADVDQPLIDAAFT